jgi:tetratricopeptide (TPR) repeat protein
MKLFLIFLIIPVLIFASSDQDISRLVKRGLEHSYHFQWKEAEKTFKKIIDKYPDDPRGYHYYSSIYIWYYLSSKSENDLDTFIKYSDDAISAAEKLLKKESKNLDAIYILGANYNYRAIAFAKDENYLDAVWASKKSESFLKDLLQLDPKNYDAYLGLGLYNFAMGQIPSAFKWALSLAGIDGSREKGLEYIRLAATEGDIAKIEAQYYYAQILSEVLFEYEEAEEYLKNLVQKYPENIVFNYTYSVLEIKQRNLKSSEKILRKILKNTDPNFKQVTSFSLFLMGDIFFRGNEFDSATVYYNKFLDDSSDNDYTGIASLRLGLCYEILGDRESAEQNFLRSKNGNMDLDDDIFARRRGIIYSSRTLAPGEIEVLKAGNLIEAGKFDEAADTLIALLDVIQNEKLKSEALLLLSDAEYHRKNYNQSLMYALKSKTSNNADEKWIKPFAAYYQARAYQKLGNISAMNNAIDEAEDYSDYDYQNKLKNLLFALKNKNNS